MEFDEVIEAVDEATNAVREYRRSEKDSKGLFEDLDIETPDEEERLKRKLSDLIEESTKFISGPSGDPCPCCDGTGRI